MRCLTWGTNTKYPVAILVKPNNFNQDKVFEYYVEPLVKLGVPKEDIICLRLDCSAKKPKVSDIKAYIERLDIACMKYGFKHLLVCESEYFKKICKVSKSEVHLSYMLPTLNLPTVENVKATIGFNYLQVVYDSTYQTKLDRALNSIADDYNGVYTPVGQDIIKSESYPSDYESIKKALDGLHIYNKLTFDIETFSLNVHKAGIGTVTFCWDKHNGIAFPVEAKEGLDGKLERIENEPVKELLRDFILKFKGKLIAHNASFDFKCALRHLFMKDATDYVGLIDNLEKVHPKIEDTKLIAYCALNSTEDYKLGLKPLSHEYSGNYGIEGLHDITKLKFKSVLKYNLKDGLCTWYVYDKYSPIMVQDDQENFYRTMLLASLKVTLVMETWGLPTKKTDTIKLENDLTAIMQDEIDFIKSTKYFKRSEYLYRVRELKKDNSTRQLQKTFAETRDSYSFNLNSNTQLQILLYDVMKLPILDVTATKKPSTGNKTITKLAKIYENSDKNSDQLIFKLLNSLVNLSAIVKIITGFIPAFKEAYDKKDGRFYINGCFNLGGTISGRLTSSDPNLQNLPAGSTFGKMIKALVSAPDELFTIADQEAYDSWFHKQSVDIQEYVNKIPVYVGREHLQKAYHKLGKEFISLYKSTDGFIFVSADFASLEDRINALLTKDPNKLKVYTDGYDGHCLRAYYYWKHEFSDINPDDPDSINSIKVTKPKMRNRSKAPTFLLTYLGTEKGLQKNCGFSYAESVDIVKNYNLLYVESKKWTKHKLEEVCRDGYATLAFGLKLRSPLLGKTILGKRTTPYQAEQEARSVANAFSGQSYCMLNNRASIEFMERVWASKYRYDIIPTLWIHDAVYLLVRNNVEVIKWVNDNLIECMEWQELPEIMHDEVKLGAELDIHYPNWSHALTLQNRLSCEEIIKSVTDFRNNGYKPLHPE